MPLHWHRVRTHHPSGQVRAHRLLPVLEASSASVACCLTHLVQNGHLPLHHPRGSWPPRHPGNSWQAQSCWVRERPRQCDMEEHREAAFGASPTEPRMLKAVHSAASSTGAAPVERGGHTTAEVLQDGEALAQAARGRSGGGGAWQRRGGKWNGARCTPTHSAHIGIEASGLTVEADAGTLTWLPARWKVLLMILGLPTTPSPSIVALMVALIIRLVCSAVMGLVIHLFKELWTQALLAATEMEDHIAFGSITAGQGAAHSPSPPPHVTNHAMPPRSELAVRAMQPTQPALWITSL